MFLFLWMRFCTSESAILRPSSGWNYCREKTPKKIIRAPFKCKSVWVDLWLFLSGGCFSMGAVLETCKDVFLATVIGRWDCHLMYGDQGSWIEFARKVVWQWISSHPAKFLNNLLGFWIDDKPICYYLSLEPQTILYIHKVVLFCV